MSLTDAQKQANRKWDKENMHSFSCRLRKHDAVLFQEYCDAHRTTPAAELKKYILNVIGSQNKP